MNNPKFVVAAIFALVIVSSCSKTPKYIPSANADVELAENEVLKMIPKGSLVLAVCGSSDGKGLYLDEKQEWADDFISEGRIVVVRLPDGKPDLLFRDATKTFYSALKEGALVSFTYNDMKKGQFGIVVVYPGGRVIETHNFMSASNGDRVDLWTVNKNIDTMITIQKASAYRAKCVK